MEDINTLLESINSDLKNAEKTIINKDKRVFGEKELNFSPLWVLLFLGGFFYLFGLSIAKESLFPVGLWMLGATLIGAGYGFMRANFYSKIEPRAKAQILILLKKHQELIETFQISESIEGILRKTQLMQSMISENLLFIKSKKLRIFKQLTTKEILFCLSILSNLRSDLSIRLEEQKKTLESAKSEVEASIGGAIELESISELQKARLDKQIEQFEELQRVLVKM